MAMSNSNILKHMSWLGGIALFLAFMSCRDFDAAFAKCQQDGTCSADGGSLGDGGPQNDGGTQSDGGTQNDGGADGGPVIIVDAGSCNLDAGLCPLSTYEHLYGGSATGKIHALWGSPTDVFLATDDGAKVVRFNGTTFTDQGAINHLSAFPYRMHGTGPNNVWAINENPGSGCDGNPYPYPGSECKLPIVRFDGTNWLKLNPVDNGPVIQPPALFTAGPDATWVATPDATALKWNGSIWQNEPASPGNMGGNIHMRAFWSSTGTAPEMAVGGYNDFFSGGSGNYWERQAGGTWLGPKDFNPLSVPYLKAIGGPSKDHLYAAGGKSSVTVLRFDRANNLWRLESPFPSLPATTQSVEVMDMWVSGDGQDLWIVLQTSFALRKHNGTWYVVYLPVDPEFQALSVEGFGNGELWITGVQYSSPSGSFAYRYLRYSR
jgi:hypothetical protein